MMCPIRNDRQGNTSMEAERRRSPRMRTLWAGVVAFNNRRSTMDCTIRNASESGALLKVSEAITLPPTFELEIPARQRRFSARVIWRRGDAIGVAFGDPASAIPTDLLRRLEASEAANVLLQERVRQLTEAG